MKYIEWPASVSWGPEDEKEYTKDGCNAFDAGVLYCMDKLEEQVKETEEAEGEWIWSLADNGWANHTCSACGYTKNTDIHVRLDWKYCPNCGLRMKVEE